MASDYVAEINDFVNVISPDSSITAQDILLEFASSVQGANMINLLYYNFNCINLSVFQHISEINKQTKSQDVLVNY